MDKTLDATVTKQRLQTLEQQIRKDSEALQKHGLRIGHALCEIRDNHLWAEEYDSWTQYLTDRAQELVGKSFVQSVKLIRAAEIQKRLPTRMLDDSSLTPSHLVEIGRLAPNAAKDSGRGVEKDYSRLRKNDVARVLKSATKIAGDKTPSVQDLRKAVDHDLGIDRAAKAKGTKQKREEDAERPNLRDYITQETGSIQGVLENLRKVPQDAWHVFNDENLYFTNQFQTACAELTRFVSQVAPEEPPLCSVCKVRDAVDRSRCQKCIDENLSDDGDSILRADQTASRDMQVAKRIIDKYADGKWHNLATIVNGVESDERTVNGRLLSMRERGMHNVFCESRKAGKSKQFRIIKGGRKKVPLEALQREIGPLLDALEREGRKHTARFSPMTVLQLTTRLRKVLEDMARSS